MNKRNVWSVVQKVCENKKFLECTSKTFCFLYKDHNPKFLITLDDDPPVLHNGIKQINVLGFLLG